MFRHFIHYLPFNLNKSWTKNFFLISIFFSSLFYFLPITKLHAGWDAQSSGISTDLHSVHFVDDDIGWAVGASGEILNTSDGGTTWTAQTSGTTSILRDVQFINSSTGIAVGNSSTFLKTINGGSTWTAVTPGISDTIFYSVFWSTNTSAWAVGELSRIRKSSDSVTWSNGAPNGTGTSEDLKSVFFINSSTGWVAGNNAALLRTYDTGDNWSSITFGALDFSQIYFINESTGWVVGNSGGTSEIYKTMDSGTNWSLQFSTTVTLNSVHFVTVDDGWIAGDSGVIFKSTNSGTSFEQEDSSATTNLNKIYLPSENIAFAVGASGTIIKNSITSTSSSDSAVIEKQGDIKPINNLFDPSNNEATTLEYTTLNSGRITIRIFSMQGQLIKLILDADVTAGSNSINWDGRNDTGEIVGSGIYIVHIQGPGFSSTAKIAIVQ